MFCCVGTACNLKRLTNCLFISDEKLIFFSLFLRGKNIDYTEEKQLSADVLKLTVQKHKIKPNFEVCLAGGY